MKILYTSRIFETVVDPPQKAMEGNKVVGRMRPRSNCGATGPPPIIRFYFQPSKKVARPSHYFCFSFSQFGNLPYLLPYLTLEPSQFFAKVCQLGQIYNGGIDFPRDLLLEPTQLTLFIAEKHMFLQHWHCWQFHTLL